jgi:hypothetical protein
VIEVEPGTLNQVRTAANGMLIVIRDDVSGVAQDLRQIDPTLRLRCNDDQSLFIVYQQLDDQGSEHLVTTARHLDQRIVYRVRELVQPDYDFVGEIHKREQAEEKRHDHEWDEVIGDMAEKLAFGFRQDLSRHESPKTRKSRAFIPGE